MQLRIYAMYRRSKKILVLLLALFTAEVASIALVIWRAIGPDSSLQGASDFCVPTLLRPN